MNVGIGIEWRCREDREWSERVGMEIQVMAIGESKHDQSSDLYVVVPQRTLTNRHQNSRSELERRKDWGAEELNRSHPPLFIHPHSGMFFKRLLRPGATISNERNYPLVNTPRRCHFVGYIIEEPIDYGL